MKKISKRLLSVLLVIAMIVTAGSMTVTSSAATVSIPDDAVEFNGHYYKVYEIQKNWEDAKTACENMGGHLATITSQAENDFVFNLIDGSYYYTFRIGLTDQSEEGIWLWITGEYAVYTNWATGQPDNDKTYVDWSGQHTAVIVSEDTSYGCEEAHWDDESPLTGIPYICEWESTEQTITTKLGGTSTENKIKLNGIWYEYDTSVPGLAEAIDRFAINETITCKIKFGKIIACSKTEIRNNLTLSINTSNNNIQYDTSTKKYSPEKISFNINATNNITSLISGTINTAYVAGYDITFDKLQISCYNGNMLYFKDGWFGLGKTKEIEKKFESPVTLKAGETFNFSEDLTAYITDDCEWGDELKKEAEIHVCAYNGETQVAWNVLRVTFKNQTAESSVKNNAELNKKIQATANLLNNTSCVIQNEFLSEIFTKEELKDISNALQCKVALYAATIDFSKNETFEEKLIKKLLKKANIDKDWIGTAYTADISLVVEVDTEEYGRIEVEFNVPMTYYVLGGGQSNSGISFNMSYKIKGGKGIPSDKKSGDILGALTYANISSFVSSVQDVALDQIESAYDLGYGDDLNKVCEMFFGETMTKILSKTAAKSYSHLTFSMMTFPSKQVKIHCPVDVYVYDSEGILCASVESNEITMTCDDIDIEVIGDEKYLTIYDGDYSIEIIATANDEMDITIEEYSSTDEMISTTSFDNVALTPGDSFKTDIDENYLDSDYQISKNDEDNIIADSNEEYIHYIDSVEIIDKDATCTEDGEYHIECAECKETVLTGTIPATEHSDANHDGVCDDCTEDFTTNCKCNCHSNAFMQFLHKILCFLYRIFGMEQYRYCNCGKAHW